MNMHSPRKAGLLRLQLCSIALLAFVSAPTFAQEGPAQPDKQKPKSENETVVLESFEVVGSRIKRTDAETPQPVVTFKLSDVEANGFTNLGDFIQRLPFNSGAQASVIQTASFTRGATTVNPRGLGAQRFLVLVNGRRAVTYPLTTGPQTLGYNVSVFDFNSIPTGAVEALEYQKDGASAIYGSDAVTGVLNIKLKKNFQGVSTDYTIGDSTQGTDMLFQEANATMGVKDRNSELMISFSWASNNSSFLRDYSRSRTTDYSLNGDANRGINQNSSSNWPANLVLTAAQAAAAGFTTGSGNYVLTGGQPSATPTKAMFGKVATIPNANRYDFAQSYQLQPEDTRAGVFINGRHDFNPNLYGFAQALYSYNATKYDFTPAVIQSTSNAGTGPSGLLNVPANNPYNPLGIDLTNFLYRTNFGQPRKFDTTADTGSLLVGLGGVISSDWTWEAAANFARSAVNTTSRNQIRASDLQAALNGTTRATALNPFGPSDNQSLVNSLFTISNSSTEAQQQTYDANVTGKLFEIDGRNVGVSIGTELRHEQLRQDPDTASYVGSGGGTPMKGSRRVFSFYAEATVPVIKQVEIQLAARYENYSDFGNTTKPKIGAKYKVLDWLVLRGSFSKAFKAPDLGTLYTTQTTAFTSSIVQDPKRPGDPATQLRIISGGNPNLKPENSDCYYAGAVIDVPRVKGLSLTVDYFRFKLSDLINVPSSTTILQREDQLPGSVIRDNTQGNPGPILYLQSVPFNIATQDYSGFDLGIQYQIKGTRFGDFEFRTDWTNIQHLKIDYGFGGGVFDNVGYRANPRWNGNASVLWSFKDYAASVSAMRVGNYYNDGYTAAGWPENAVYVANVVATYKGFRWAKISVGIDNVANAQPPFNGRTTQGFDQEVYAFLSQGRTAFIRISKEF